ncbi:MAG: methylenetetrahydrofolate reductase [Ectothiorhodospiraceae bacterium AqS1]|nr:methylenetetrahydrofolate reductase [Ectothiorhodospiraceae bacterium AqS1]
MAAFAFRSQPKASMNPQIKALIDGYSIEVMPRTASKIEDFRALLPSGTRVYIAHVEGTHIDDMVATAKRLRLEGFAPMPHFPARIIKDRKTLALMIARYRDEANVDEGLVLAGGAAEASGDFDSSMQLLESGLFADFRRLHIAGHPEGNRDIDPDGGERGVMEALAWKQRFAACTDADFAIATQFSFDPEAIIAWAERLRDADIEMPIHIGIAGPAKLQTLIKFALSCGIGPSLFVLQKRARDITKLLLPFEPTAILNRLAQYKSDHPKGNIAGIHFFPLGGIQRCASWIAEHGAAQPAKASNPS